MQPIIEAVHTASTLCKRLQQEGTGGVDKADTSPVTIADYSAQAIICRAISHHYPGDTVIGEEDGTSFSTLLSDEDRARVVVLLAETLGESVDQAQVAEWLDYGTGGSADKRTWVIDPIDGTVGFIGNRYYAVCVGVLVGGQPVDGIIGMPKSPLHESGTIAYTEDGRVFVVPMGKGESPREVRANTHTDPAKVKVLESYKLKEDRLKLNADLREAAGLGSPPVEYYDSQLKYAMVAAGYGDLFVRLPRDMVKDPHKTWDHAAGAALLMAAGAKITGTEGEPVDFSQGIKLPHRGFIATNGPLHEQVVAAAKKMF